MAVSLQECHEISSAAMTNNVILAIGHVLRYAQHYKLMKQIIDSGRLGNVVSIEHVESVGYYHFAHSYVRGNWRNEATATFSLMAKCCHDLDLLLYFMGAPCTVTSFVYYCSTEHSHKRFDIEGEFVWRTPSFQ